MRILVLGAGLQGSACAFDLLNDSSVQRVMLADVRVATLPAFLQPFASADGSPQGTGARLVPMTLDVRDPAAVRAAFAECDAVCSAIPYYFNFPLAELAVE